MRHLVTSTSWDYAARMGTIVTATLRTVTLGRGASEAPPSPTEIRLVAMQRGSFRDPVTLQPLGKAVSADDGSLVIELEQTTPGAQYLLMSEKGGRWLRWLTQACVKIDGRIEFGRVLVSNKGLFKLPSGRNYFGMPAEAFQEYLEPEAESPLESVRFKGELSVAVVRRHFCSVAEALLGTPSPWKCAVKPFSDRHLVEAVDAGAAIPYLAQHFREGARLIETTLSVNMTPNAPSRNDREFHRVYLSMELCTVSGANIRMHARLPIHRSDWIFSGVAAPILERFLAQIQAGSDQLEVIKRSSQPQNATVEEVRARAIASRHSWKLVDYVRQDPLGRSGCYLMLANDGILDETAECELYMAAKQLHRPLSDEVSQYLEAHERRIRQLVASRHPDYDGFVAPLGTAIGLEYVSASACAARAAQWKKEDRPRKSAAAQRSRSRPRAKKTRDWRLSSDSCPRCGQERLREADLPIGGKDHADERIKRRIWRCPACQWRQMVVSDAATFSPTTPVQRPVADLGDALFAEIQGFLERMTKETTESEFRELGLKLDKSLENEVLIDSVLTSKKRRELRSEELQFLIGLFSKSRKAYNGELKAHWDKTVEGQFRNGWPEEGLLRFLKRRPRYDASLKVVTARPRCTKCRIETVLYNTVYESCGFSVPNPLDIRDQKISWYRCPRCDRFETVSEDA